MSALASRPSQPEQQIIQLVYHNPEAYTCDLIAKGASKHTVYYLLNGLVSKGWVASTVNLLDRYKRPRYTLTLAGERFVMR